MYGLMNVPTWDIVRDAPIEVFLTDVGNNSDVYRAKITKPAVEKNRPKRANNNITVL